MFNKKVKIVIKIEGMSCSHCANKVKNALESIDNIKNVKIDLAKKHVIILSDGVLDEKQLKGIIEQLDYKYCGIVKE